MIANQNKSTVIGSNQHTVYVEFLKYIDEAQKKNIFFYLKK